MGHKTVPPEPTEPSGLPALLGDGPAHREHLHALASALDVSVEPPPAEVGLFGTVSSVSAGTLTITPQPGTAQAPGGEVEKATSFVATGRPVQVRVGREVDFHLLPGGASSLTVGRQVFVGGRLQNGVISAQLIADPRGMFEGISTSDAEGASAAVPPRGAATPYPTAPALASSSEASAPTPGPTGGSDGRFPGTIRNADLTGSEGHGSARFAADTASSGQFSPDNVDTVTLSGSYGLPGFDPHFSAGVGDPNGNGCSAGVDAEFLADAHAQFNWAFQFAPSGTGFTVSSLDRQPTAGGSFSFAAGPFSGEGTIIRDFDNYSVYSAWGLAIGAHISVSCHVHIAFVNGTIGFTALGIGVSFAFQNETKRHVPLKGEADLRIPPSMCPVVGGTVGPLTLGIGVCQTLTLHGGLLRATLTGPGGTPQGVALGYGATDHLQAATAPAPGPVRVDHFNFAASDTTTMDAGLLLDLSLDKSKKEGEQQGATSGNFAKEYFTAERHENQVGPSTPSGAWQESGDNRWYDAQGHETTAPSSEEIQQGLANWVHPGQQGPTLAHGQWKDANGRWRGADGRFIATPTEGVNPATASGDESGRADKADEEDEPDLESQLHGWTYQTVNGSFSPPNVAPAALELNLTVPVVPVATALKATFGQSSTPQAGHSVDVTVTDAQHPAGDPTATGSVTVLFDGQQRIGSGAVDAGRAHLVTIPGDPGAGAITVSYSGDDLHAPSEACAYKPLSTDICQAHKTCPRLTSGAGADVEMTGTTCAIAQKIARRPTSPPSGWSCQSVATPFQTSGGQAPGPEAETECTGPASGKVWIFVG